MQLLYIKATACHPGCYLVLCRLPVYVDTKLFNLAFSNSAVHARLWRQNPLDTGWNQLGPDGIMIWYLYGQISQEEITEVYIPEIVQQNAWRRQKGETPSTRRKISVCSFQLLKKFACPFKYLNFFNCSCILADKINYITVSIILSPCSW